MWRVSTLSQSKSKASNLKHTTTHWCMAFNSPSERSQRSHVFILSGVIHCQYLTGTRIGDSLLMFVEWIACWNRHIGTPSFAVAMMPVSFHLITVTITRAFACKSTGKTLHTKTSPLRFPILTPAPQHLLPTNVSLHCVCKLLGRG